MKSMQSREKSRKVKANVLLTTYELILRDAALLGDIKWQALAVDEVSCFT